MCIEADAWSHSLQMDLTTVDSSNYMFVVVVLSGVISPIIGQRAQNIFQKVCSSNPQHWIKQAAKCKNSISNPRNSKHQWQCFEKFYCQTIYLAGFQWCLWSCYIMEVLCFFLRSCHLRTILGQIFCSFCHHCLLSTFFLVLLWQTSHQKMIAPSAPIKLTKGQMTENKTQMLC